MDLKNNLELSDIKKYKNQVLNIGIIILAILIAANIYKKQDKAISLLNAQKELEVMKNTEFNNIGSLEKKNNAFKNYLVKKDPGLIINTISSFANELGIKILSIKPESAIKFEQYSKWPFEIAFIASSYHDLGRFISKIENSKDLLVIDNISVKREAKEKSLFLNLRFSSIALN